MQKLVWQNANGDSIDLTSGNYGITEWEGFSNTSLNIQSQQVPFQDGAVYLDALLNQRDLSVTLKMQDNGNLEERYRMRRELIHILNPKLGEGYLIYTNDFISKRIKCVAQVPLFPTHNSNDSGTPSASLSWTACNPYWEDLEETEVQIEKEQEVEVINGGDVPVQIKADFDTSCNNFVFQNLTTKQKIQIANNINWNINLNTNVGEKKIEKDSFIAQYNRGGSFESIVALDDKMLCVGLQFIVIDLNGNETTVKTGVVKPIRDVVYANGLYIICGGDYYSSNFIKVSEDLINWIDATHPSVGNQYFTLISYEDNLFKVKVSNNTYLTSTDGYNWTQQSTTILKSKTQIKVEDLYIKVDDNKIKTSIDNSTWTDIYTIQPPTQYADVYFTSLCYFFGNYYFVGSAGLLLKSSDLNTFEFLKYTPMNQLFYVAVSDDYVFLADSGNGIIKSSNLEDWSIVYFPSTLMEINDLFYAKGLLFVLSAPNKILISANNGDTFETVTISDELTALTSIYCYNDVFYLFGYSHTYKSTDGYNWSILFSEIDIGENVYIPYKMTIYKNYCYLACYIWGGQISRGLGILKTNDFVNFESVYIEDYVNFRGNEVTIASDENNLIVTIVDYESHAVYLYQTSDGLNYIKSNISSKLDYPQCYQSLFINGVLWIINRSNRAYYTKDFKTFNYIECVALSLFITSICFFKNNILFGGGGAQTMVTMSYSKFESENIINELTKDSNMDFKLNLGKNNLLLLTASGNASGTIKYRQKYLGV